MDRKLPRKVAESLGVETGNPEQNLKMLAGAVSVSSIERCSDFSKKIGWRWNKVSTKKSSSCSICYWRRWIHALIPVDPYPFSLSAGENLSADT
jgi:hypothetical protein